MKTKKIIASALAVMTVFSVGVNIIPFTDKLTEGFAVTAYAESFGNTVLKDGDRFELKTDTNPDNCTERKIMNEDYDKVYDGNEGIYQWDFSMFGYVNRGFTLHGPYKVTDKETGKEYWGFTSTDGLGVDPPISYFIGKNGMLFEIPEGESRTPAGLLVTDYYKHTGPDATFNEYYKTRLYFGGKVVKLENITNEKGKEGSTRYTDQSIVYETDEKTIKLPSCSFDPPEEGMQFGGWKMGKKIYQAGDTVKLGDRLNRFEPVWGKPEKVSKINVTVTAPMEGEVMSEKAKTDLEGAILFVPRLTNSDLSDEEITVNMENVVEWSVDGKDLPYDKDTGKLKTVKAQKGKTYTATFFLKNNDKYTFTTDTKVYINGQEAKVRDVIGMFNTVKCSVEFKTIAAKPKYAKGDVNGDGRVDIEDAVAVIGHVNGNKALTAEENERADVDGNSNIDIEDAVAIIGHVNGLKALE